MYLKKCDHCGTIIYVHDTESREGSVRIMQSLPDRFKASEVDLCRSCFGRFITIIQNSDMKDILKEDFT